MPGRRETRLAVARVDQLAILGELTDAALVLQEIKPVLDPETTQEEIKRRVAEQANQILDDAETDCANYESARALAERTFGRADYVSWGICGIAAGYILSTDLLASPRPIYGLTAIVVAVLSGVLVVCRGIRRRRRKRLLRGLAAARGRWLDGLRDRALLPFILQTLNDLTRDSVLYAACLNPGIPPRLVERSEPRRLVASEAMDRIRTIVESMREGSLGVSGPRGVGKTTIVRYFCDDAYQADGSTPPGRDAIGEVSPPGEPELRVVLSAPVDYQPRDFILHLFIKLAETVLDSALGAAAGGTARDGVARVAGPCARVSGLARADADVPAGSPGADGGQEPPSARGPALLAYLQHRLERVGDALARRSGSPAAAAGNWPSSRLRCLSW